MKYPQAVFSFFLISILFWNTFYVSVTYAYYYIDQSGFIERFCENIDKPEMECNGKCHLKEVVEKKTTNNEVPINLIITEKINLFFENNNDLDLHLCTIERKERTDGYFNLYSYTREYSWYHPPQA